MTTDTVFVYVTHPDAEGAQALAHSLVEARLAACVNVIPGMQSTYGWQGNIETDDEVVMIVKTRRELFDRVRAHIQANHPYDCPCIVALPVVAGDPGYLHWILEGTTAEKT